MKRTPFPTRRSPASITQLAVLFVCTVSGLALVGWVFGITFLKSIESRWIEMRVITALCLAGSALALALVQRRRAAAAALAGGVGLIGLLTLAILAFRASGTALTGSPVLRLFLAPTTRMAFWTAGIFLINASALLLLAHGGRRCANAAHVLALPAAVASYVVPVSYVLGVESVHRLLGVPVALNTGVAFCALSVGIFCLRPDTWLMRVFTEAHAGSGLARRMFPVLLALPIVIGWMRLYGERQGIFASEAGVVLVAIAYTVCLLGFLWLSARSVNRADRQRGEVAAALGESERRFATTLASIGDAVIATDASGRITFFNAVAEGLCGWTPQEAHGQSVGAIFRIIDERTHEPAEDIVTRVLEEERVVLLANHTALVRRDGHEIPIEDSAAPIKDEFGRVVGVVLVFRDVTKRRQAQRALRDSEARLRSLYASMAEGLAVHEILHDDSGRAMDYRILDINPAYERITRIPRAQAVGIPASVLYGSGSPPYLDVYAEVARTGRPATFETYFAPMQKHFRISVFSPGADLFATVFEDITERKQAEAALHRSRDELDALVQERTAALKAVNLDLTRTLEDLRASQAAVTAEQRQLRDVLEMLPVYVALLTPDYHVPFANRFFRERFGDSGGRRCFEFLFGRTEPCESCETYTVLKTMAPHRWDWTGPDGRAYAIADYPFINTDGSTLIMEVGIDVTERNRAEDELRSVNAKLEERATQLRALTTELAQAEDRERRRLAQVLHDHLQQLLVAATFSAGSMRRTAVGESHRAEAERILEILEQAIAASRSLTMELSPPILQGAGLLAKLTWLAGWMHEKHNFRVDVTAHARQEDLAADLCLLIFQAVRELLFNAVKHSGVRRARVVVEDGAPDELRVTVSDEGIGFDPAARDAADRAEGFGLFNIRERLAFFEGRMRIESAPGKGTRAILELPVRREAAPDPAPPPSVPARAGAPEGARGDGKRIRVLVADDHPVVRRGLVQMLGAEPGLDVVGEAVDGCDAVERTRALRPDVVLIDLTMPRMNGMEATRLMVAEMPELRVIGLSMHAQENAARQMLEAGAVRYMVKDSPIEEIVAAIREVCHKAGLEGGGSD